MIIKLLSTIVLAGSILCMTTPSYSAVATFAGGCFWCMQPLYDKLPGVIKTVAGYSGGSVVNPSYQQVSKGGTGHYEVVQVTYDPNKINYRQLINIYWKNIDPTDDTGQFCDKGSSYRSAIFYHNKRQQQIALASKQAIQDSGRFKHIYTKILPASSFYPAELYHQDYYKKNPIRYKVYRYNCGRDARLKQIWGNAN